MMIQSINGVAPIDIAKFNELNTNLNPGNNSPNISEGKFSFDISDKALKETISTKDNNVESNKQVNFKQLSDQLKSLLNDKNLSVEFSLDKDSKRMIMKIVNETSKEVVQQFPPEIALKIARIVSQTLEVGNITNAKV